VLEVDATVCAKTIEQFRRCGEGRRECVAYWVALLLTADRIDGVVHPDHSAMPWHYRVDDAWLSAFWGRLARERRTVRAQVHTHGGRAGHSETDDEFPAVHEAGFLSLVLPRFAMGPLDPAAVYVARYERGGGWSRHSLEDTVTEVA
jgi:hypothetical protein